jgi:hypothetical protein
MNASSKFPLWFPLYFAALWMFVSTILAFLSGWRHLGAKYKTQTVTEGRKFYMQSAGIGAFPFSVGYRGCLTFVVTDEGFCVQPILLFRFLSPKLFIPWKDVAYVSMNSRGIFPSYHIKLKESWVSFQLFDASGAAIYVTWSKHH